MERCSPLGIGKEITMNPDVGVRCQNPGESRAGDIRGRYAITIMPVRTRD